MAAKIQINNTDNSSSLNGISGKQHLLFLRYNDNRTERDQERRLGIYRQGGKKRREEESEMFTIAGIHKDMRNGQGKPQSAGKIWLVLSKHSGLLKLHHNSPHIPMI